MYSWIYRLLLIVSIYVIEDIFLREHPEIPQIDCKVIRGASQPHRCTTGFLACVREADCAAKGSTVEAHAIGSQYSRGPIWDYREVYGIHIDLCGIT